MDKVLLKKIVTLANSDQKKQEEAHDLLSNYLQKNPYDTDIWFRLIMLYYSWYDEAMVFLYINKVLSYEKNLEKIAYCLLILAYIEEHHVYENMQGHISHELFNKLDNISVENKSTASMIEIAKAWYYKFFEKNELYEQSLQKSIEYDSTIARNYYDLGEYYINKKYRYKEGNDLIRKAIANVNRISVDSENFAKLRGSLTSHEKKIYTDDFSDLDNTSVQQFFDERYKMLCISFVIYNNMRSYLL